MSGSLKLKAYSGVKWTTVSSVISTITMFVQLAILARLLLPEDFGLVAMVMIVVGFVQLFSDAGVSAAIIHHQEISKKQLSSLYWLNILSGFIVFLIVLSITPLVALFFDEIRLRPLLYLAAISFLIIPVGQQFQILLQKELNFNLIAKIEIIATLCGAIFAISAAYLDTGAFSIIIGQLAKASLQSVLLLIHGLNFFKPQFHFTKSDLKGFIGFGLYQMGEKSINYFHSRVDQLLIGKMLSVTELGYYNLAFNLMIQPLSRINPIINRVIFPIYAKVQHDNIKLRSGYFETRMYLTLINFPLLIGLAATAKPFVLVVYGQQWAPSIPIIEIISFIGLYWVAGNPIGSLLLAKGRADLGFKWNLIVFIITPIFVYIAAHYGVIEICYMILLLNTIYVILGYFFLIKPLLGTCKREMYIETFLIPFAYAISMGILVKILINVLPLSNIWLLVTGISIGVIFYIAILLIFEKKRVLELKSFFV